MKSTELKKRIAKLCGLRPSQLAASGVGTWTSVRIRPTNLGRWDAPLTFPGEIPVLFRRIALAVAYGPDSSLAGQASAGNVESHSICLLALQWDRFFEAVDATAACCETHGNEIEVAFSYLRNRNPITA